MNTVRARRGLVSALNVRWAACAVAAALAPAALADIAGFTQGGAGATDYTLNGNTEATTAGVPSITAGVLKATSNANSQATSAFYNTPQSITNWTASFVYDLGLGSANPADGFALVLHNDPRGPAARGDSGGAIGYSGGSAAIRNSFALGYDIYNGAATNPTRTGTAILGSGFSYESTAPVNLRTNPVRVDVAYRDGVLTQTLTDTVTSQSVTRSYARTLPLYTGGNTALVGFTAGTGGANAEQFISNFTYTAGNAPTPPALPPTTPLLSGVPTGGMGFFGVREVVGAGPMGNLAQAEAGVTGATGTRTDYTAPHINILDTGNPGDFTAPINPDNPYRSNGANVGDPDQINDTALVATGVIRVPVAGAYTFGVSSDDGFRLIIGGQRFEGAVNASVTPGGAMEFTGGRGADNVSLGVVVLPAGDHPIQLLNWEGGGGASVELVSAPGVHSTMDTRVFNLVGAPEATLIRRAGTISPNGFQVVTFNGITDPDAAGPLNALDAAITAFNEFKAGTRTPAGQGTFPTVFFSDPQDRGANRNGQADFGPDRAFPGDTAAGDNDFAAAATGSLNIATGGVYTFDVVSDDLFRFRITDASGNDVDLLGTGGGGSPTGVNTDADAANDAFRSTGCCADTFGYYNLAPGNYNLEVIMQEGGGGASFSLYGAFGQQTVFDPTFFQLVGQNIDSTTVRPAGLALVPEPGTMTLLGMAAFGLMARRRRA